MIRVLAVLLLSFSSLTYSATCIRKDNSIIFNFNQNEIKNKSKLKLYFNNPKTEPKVVEIDSNKYVLKLRKLPRRIYWKVNSGRLQEFVIQKKYIVRAGLGYESNRYSLDSSSVKEKGTASGPGLFLSGEFFFDKFGGTKSLRVGINASQLTGSSVDIDKREVTIEVGTIIRKTKHYHQIFLGYYNYSLDYKFDDFTAKYAVHFISGRYLFKMDLDRRSQFELNTEVRFPYPLRANLGLNLRPTYIYKLNTNFSLEGFLLYDYFSTKVKEDSLNEMVTINSASFGTGVGVNYHF